MLTNNLNFAYLLAILFGKTLTIDETIISRNNTHNLGTIQLIGWRWDAVGRYFVLIVFFLMGAFAKIFYHNTKWLRTQIPESCVLIILGLIVGLFVHMTNISISNYIPTFTADKFFSLYLPPIILESAYALYDRTFFNNIGSILLFAIAGTIINIAAIGSSLQIFSTIGFFYPFILTDVECFTFATIISAVDPVAVIAIFQEVNVDKALYFMVFGESLLNDAVVITIYNTMIALAKTSEIKYYHILMSFASFISISGGGIIIGILLGIFTSIITRLTKNVRVIEPLVVILCAYIAYFASELFHFSGIISLICCGLIQAHYTRQNISDKSYTTIKYLMKTLASISDVVIFIFLGMVLIRYLHVWNINFILTVLLFCLIYRFLSVFLLTYVANNWFNRLRLITCPEQFIMSYGGLRGAIAFALSIMLNPDDIPSVDLMISTTLIVIIFTVFIQGTTTKPIVRFLGLQMNISDKKSTLFGEVNYKIIETAMRGLEEITGQATVLSAMKRRLDKFNENIIEKVLTKTGSTKWLVMDKRKRKLDKNERNKIFTVLRSIPRHSYDGNCNMMNWKKNHTIVPIYGNGVFNKKHKFEPKHVLTAARRMSDVSLPFNKRFSTESSIEEYRDALNAALEKVPFYHLPRTRNLSLSRRNSIVHDSIVR